MLPHQDRVKLLFGPYQMPKCTVGRPLRCLIRGKVRVAGITDTPIPWPYAHRHRKDKRPSIIVCGDLVRALRRESETAIAHAWGVSIVTVWRWRKALGVEQFTEGTRDLYRRWLPEKLDEDALSNLADSLKSPERNEKIAASQRGRPMPEHVKRKPLNANKGHKLSAEHRRKLSEAHKGRGSRPVTAGPPWQPDEIALLGTMPDREVAAQIGRSTEAVRCHRYVLGIACFSKRKPPCRAPRWTEAKDRLLGTMPDPVLARKWHCSAMCVFNRRRKLGIPAHRGD
jgi:hypothetical protein